MVGKCKKDFEKWYSNPIRKELQYRELRSFYDLPHPMQWGVIVDFFDSVGINIEIAVYQFNDGGECFEARTCNDDLEQFRTRHEARAAAIEKATETYNERS